MNALKNITPLGWLGALILLNGVIIGGTSQLTDLFGSGLTHKLVSVASLANMFFGGLVSSFSKQSDMIKNVLAMPGVEKISVNAQANTTLATIAMDPSINKIAPTPAAVDAVTKTASAA